MTKIMTAKVAKSPEGFYVIIVKTWRLLLVIDNYCIHHLIYCTQLWVCFFELYIFESHSADHF